MSQQEFLNYWYTGLIVAAIIVVVVAVLLLTLIFTARRILANARRALGVATEIEANTRPIWALDQTSGVAADLLTRTAGIGQHAMQLADVLGPAQSGVAGDAERVVSTE